MDQLGNQLEIALAKDILWVYQNQCQPLDENKFFRFRSDEFTIEQNKEEEGTTPVYSQSTSIVVNMMRSEQQLFNNQNLIVRLTTLRNKQIIWGTKDYPVRCTIVPDLDHVTLNLLCKSPIPLPY